MLLNGNEAKKNQRWKFKISRIEWKWKPNITKSMRHNGSIHKKKVYLFTFGFWRQGLSVCGPGCRGTQRVCRCELLPGWPQNYKDPAAIIKGMFTTPYKRKIYSSVRLHKKGNLQLITKDTLGNLRKTWINNNPKIIDRKRSPSQGLS